LQGRVIKEDGYAVNCGEFNGLKTAEFKQKITAWLEKNKVGKKTVNYKLRDWLFSRQRYWGEPIPIVHCKECGNVAVPEKELPLELPDIKKYEPTGTGKSPLAAIDSWVNTKCPKCGGSAKRETNTMPQWAGSNWYFLRYCDPHNDKTLADLEKLKAWLPVDLYIGGAEHAVLHLLYARFIYKFLFDIDAIPKEVGDEPFIKLKNQGLIMGEDGVKMSKSRGNVINPDEVIKKYGADTMRMYEMFMGPFEDSKPWDTKGIIGIKRFLNRLFGLIDIYLKYFEEKGLKIKWLNNKFPEKTPDDLLKHLNKVIKKVTVDIENFKFNTAISELMILLNSIYPEWIGVDSNNKELYIHSPKVLPKKELEKFLIIISPFAPHICEELWEILGHKKSIALESWPEYDEAKIIEKEVTIVVQVNGKLRDTITIARGATREEVRALALQSEKVTKHLPKGPKRTIFVKDRLINFVF